MSLQRFLCYTLLFILAFSFSTTSAAASTSTSTTSTSTTVTTTGYYTCNSCTRETTGYSCPSKCSLEVQCSGTGGIDVDCEKSTTSITTTTSTTTTIPCSLDTPSQGYCDFSNNITATTPASYYPSAGNGELAQEPQGGVQTTPVTQNVITYDSGNPQWLITCPNTPNPANSWEYILSSQDSPAPVIGGDECLASSTPITTSDIGNLYVSWSPTSKATATLQAVQQGGQLSITNLAYAGEAYNSIAGLSSANASNGYDTFTNVFSPIPSAQQSGIWTWNGKLGDTSELSGYNWQEAQVFNSLLVTNTINNVACQYQYDYSVVSDVSSVTPINNVPVPITPNPTQNYISFNNQTFPNFQQGNQYGANAIAMSQCYLPNFWGPWHLVGFNGIVNYQGSTQSPVCIYQYSSVPDYWAAYNSPNGEQVGYAPSNTLTFENFPFIPHFLYNFSIPISTGSLFNSGTSYLNASYYMYSPHNIQSPGNFIDPFTIGGGNMSVSTSGIFLSTNGILAQLSYPAFFGSSSSCAFKNGACVQTTSPQPGSVAYNGLDVESKSFIIAANYIVANVIFGLRNAQPIGTSYSISNITNTLYLSSSASNHMFVVGSAPECNFVFCYNTQGYDTGIAYYLYGISLVPKGYFNPTLYTPSNSIAQSEGLSSPLNFQNAVKAYWYNVSAIQSSTGYVTEMYNITSLTSGFYPWLKLDSYKSTPSCTMPLAMTSDSEGDAFVITANITQNSFSGTTLFQAGSGFDLLAISNNGTVAAANVVSGPYASQLGVDIAPSSCSNGNSYPTSIAVSPDGKYLYVSERGMPRVLIYHMLYYGDTLNVSYSGAINLAYNNVSSGYNLSISEYLQGGGPFNSTPLKIAYSNPTSPISDLGFSSGNEIEHVPLGVADSGGIVYVLDEWLFNANSCNYCSGKQANDAILMLRAFTYNGTEIPIHPATYEDMFNPNGESLSTGYAGAYTNPPYGWPLAANFTIWNKINQGSSTPYYLSFCAFACLLSPSLPPTSDPNFGGFPPYGPFIGAEWASPSGSSSTPYPDIIPQQFSFSSDFNNTIYLDEQAYSSPSTSADICGTAPNCVGPFYNELAALHFNPYNYTRIASTPIVSAVCYIGVNTIWIPHQFIVYDTPCQSVDNLTMQTTPLGGMPDAFTYAEGLGSPNLYTAAPITTPSIYSSSYSVQEGSTKNGASRQQDYAFASSPNPTDPPKPPPTLTLTPNPAIYGQAVTAECTTSANTCDIEEPLNQPLPTPTLPATCNTASSSSGNTETCTFNSINLGAGTFEFYSRNNGATTYSSANLLIASSASPILSVFPNVVTLGNTVNAIAQCSVPTDTCDIEMPLGTPIQSSTARATCNTASSSSGNTETCTFNSINLGAGSYTIYAKDISGQYAGNFVSASLLIVPPVTTIPSVPAVPRTSFLKSNITGSLLIPYSYLYSLTQAWTPEVDNSITDNPTCASNPLDFGPAQVATGTAYRFYPASANSVLNETLQSGLLLAQFQSNKQYFIANLSDIGLISPPELYMNIFENRILGEAYINQSVSPEGLIYPSPPSTQGPTTVYSSDGLVSLTAVSLQYFGIKGLITVQDSSFPPSSQPSAVLPPGVQNYMLVTLGTPGEPSPWASVSSPTVQQEIQVNLADYPEYVNSTPFNVEWFYPSNGQIIPSWLESVSNTMVATYWLKISNTVKTIAIGFGPTNANFFNSQNTGEAPKLSTPTGGYQPSDYGEFDDGANVFTNYWNFAGTSLPSGWVNNGQTVTVNNGVTLTPSGQTPPNWARDSITYANENFYGKSYVLESYTSVTTLGNADINPTLILNSNSPTAYSDSYNFADDGIDLSATAPAYYHDSQTASGSVTRDSITMPSGYSYSSFNIYQSFVDGASVGVAVDYSSILNTQTNYNPSTQYIGIGSWIGSVIPPAPPTPPTTVTYWLRTRVYPPNGVMPGYTLSAVYPQYETTLSIQSQATGQTVATASTPGSPLNYVLCSGGNACPLPGNYILTGCGITNLQGGGRQSDCTTGLGLQILPNKPISLVINASHTYNYSQEDFVQNSVYGTYPGFSAENAIEQQPPTFNAPCSFCSAAGYYYNPANLFSGNNILTYASANSLNFDKLFSQLKEESYIYTIGLDLRYNPAVLGYNRLNYTYIDEFNNTINMPLDIDLANITTINLNATTVLSPTNTNETIVTVNGIAGYYPSAFSTQLAPLPPNSPIYLYYDTNINFYSQSLSPLSNPSTYYSYADQCAFGSESGCVLANPSLSSNIPPIGQGPLGPQLANVITFNTQYNSTGQCPPQPTSLLTTANTWECNIYGDFGLPQTGTSAQGHAEYCVPDYVNGTGVLTSQLGLIGIARTNPAGGFGYSFTVCGTGTARVEASYYGYPTAQPQAFYQPPLQQPPSNSLSEYSKPLLIPSIEFNYTVAPNSTYTSFPIGTYYLSFGDITSIAMIAIAVVLAIYLIIRLNSNAMV